MASEYPCEWAPGAVMNQSTGLPYFDRDAWQLIADVLEAGVVRLDTIELKVPPGRTAYVLLIPQGAATAPIYVKLQLGSGLVLARSFHYSDFAEKP